MIYIFISCWFNLKTQSTIAEENVKRTSDVQSPRPLLLHWESILSALAFVQ